MFGVMTIAFPALADTKPKSMPTRPNASSSLMHRSDSRPDNSNSSDRIMMRNNFIGTVSNVSGNTLTIVSRPGFGKPGLDNKGPGTTTFTVDAANAKITKRNATSSISNVAVGDIVIVQGTLNGTNITATIIRDNIGLERNATSTPPFTSDGQPITAGRISAIDGQTITIANRSNVSYTIDASSSKILQGRNESDISTLKTGDTVIVQGAVNGTSISASTILDQTKPINSNNSRPGFFGRIGQFFMHVLGF